MNATFLRRPINNILVFNIMSRSQGNVFFNFFFSFLVLFRNVAYSLEKNMSRREQRKKKNVKNRKNKKK